jgi:tetratricopeptide (TPR) repeat protein
MEDPRIGYRRLRQRRQEYKDLAAQGCYSVMIVMVALLVLRPLMVDQILSRADAYCAVGQFDESKRQVDKALLLDDDNSQAWCLLARIYKIRGERGMAHGAYDKAVQADCANVVAHFELAVMYMDDGRYLLAIPHLEQIRTLGPDRAQGGPSKWDSYHRASLYMLVLCYEKAGDPVKTEMTLKEIRAFYPESGNPEEHLLPLRANNVSR